MPEPQDESVAFDMKYVAYCDVLGFSHAVETRFHETISLYKDLMNRIREWPQTEKARISVYSDSILITSDELIPVLSAVQALWFITLTQDWMIRGGISYGRYWEEKRDGNAFVVSDALVRAVRLESTVRVPAVVLAEDIDIPLGAWMLRFEHGPFVTPLLHHSGLNVVNPFNRLWFASARLRVSQLMQKYPEQSDKYLWFLGLSEAVESNDVLVPETALQELIRLEYLEVRPPPEEAPKSVD